MAEEMVEEGKYLYCIIGSDQARDFGPLGIGGRGDLVTTISHDGLSGVISNSSMKKYVTTRENTITHEKAIEEVMKQGYTVLPVRFGTVADTTQDVRSVLQKRYQEFKDLLEKMDNKIELGIKALWINMDDQIFPEIVEEREDIRILRNRAAHRSTRERLIQIGELVQKALEEKKEKERALLLKPLEELSIDTKVNNSFGDRMFLNAAFLVDRSRDKEFDDQIRELRERYAERMKITYVGPAPIFNFVNIVIHWEEIREEGSKDAS